MRLLKRAVIGVVIATCTLVAGGSAVAATVLAHWNLDDPSGGNGSTMENVAVAGLDGVDGTYNGAHTSIAGVFGDATTFVGDTKGIVPLDSALQFDVNQPFSVSLWLRRSSDSSDRRPWGKLQAGDGDGGWSLISQGGANNVKLQMRNNNSSGGGNASTQGGFELQNTGWHHVVTTYNGNQSASGFELWIDGNKQTLTGSGTLTGWVHTARFALGSSGGDTGFNNWDGDLDEAWIVAGTLSEGQIDSLRTRNSLSPPANVVGDPLINRAISADGSAGQVYLKDATFGESGGLATWAFFDNENVGRNITPVILAKSGTTYAVTGIGRTRSSGGAGAQLYAFDLLAGSNQVVPGVHTFGYFDGAVDTGGNWVSNNQGSVDFDYDAGSGNWLFTGSQSFTFALGQSYDKTGLLNGNPLHLWGAHDGNARTYSAQATSHPGFTEAIHHTGGVKNRSGNDGYTGEVLVLGETGVGQSAGFSKPGYVVEWQIYNDNNSGRQITPLIVHELGGGDYELTGIGATRTSVGSGLHVFDFDPVTGSALVGPGYFFGWHDGGFDLVGGTTHNAGVPEYNSSTDDTMIRLRLDGTSNNQNVDLVLNATYMTDFAFSPGNGWGRSYSIGAVAVVPEPGTLVLLGLGALALVPWLRRRGRGG